MSAPAHPVNTSWFLKMLTIACFFIMVICGIACAFFTFHDIHQELDWIGAGLIAGGVGGILLLIV